VETSDHLNHSRARGRHGLRVARHLSEATTRRCKPLASPNSLPLARTPQHDSSRVTRHSLQCLRTRWVAQSQWASSCQRSIWSSQLDILFRKTILQTIPLKGFTEDAHVLQHWRNGVHAPALGAEISSARCLVKCERVVAQVSIVSRMELLRLMSRTCLPITTWVADKMIGR
jgi:hypothetical protein